jgi:hypothetical protein
VTSSAGLPSPDSFDGVVDLLLVLPSIGVDMLAATNLRPSDGASPGRSSDGGASTDRTKRCRDPSIHDMVRPWS